MIYITRQFAKDKMGMTHEGRMHGLPCWLDLKDEDAPAVCFKFTPLEFLFPLFDWIYFTFGGAHGLWPILVGEEI